MSEENKLEVKKEETKSEEQEETKPVSYNRPRKYNKKNKVSDIKVEPIIVTKKRQTVTKPKVEEEFDEDLFSSPSDSESEEEQVEKKTSKSKEKKKKTFLSKLWDSALDYSVQLVVPLVIFGIGSIYELTKKKPEKEDEKKKEDQNMNNIFNHATNDPWRS